MRLTKPEMTHSANSKAQHKCKSEVHSTFIWTSLQKTQNPYFSFLTLVADLLTFELSLNSGWTYTPLLFLLLSASSFFRSMSSRHLCYFNLLSSPALAAVCSALLLGVLVVAARCPLSCGRTFALTASQFSISLAVSSRSSNEN